MVIPPLNNHNNNNKISNENIQKYKNKFNNIPNPKIKGSLKRNKIVQIF